MEAYISNIAYYLPKSTLSNDDIVKLFPEWSVDKIAKKVGINVRHIVDENETATDIAIRAAEKLFSDNDINRSTIDFVLFCTQSPDYVLPSSACLIQNRLGLSSNCGALDFNLGCSGYVYGLSLAKGLICGGMAKKVLLLTAETYSKYIHPKDKGNRTIFGDGASATLIENEGKWCIGNFVFGTDGSRSDALIVKTGGSRQKELLGDERYDANGNISSSDYLSMDGSEIFNFSAEVVPLMVSELLQKNNLSLLNVDLVLLHQANQYMLKYLRQILEIDKDKFFMYLSEVGNTVSSTIPIAMCEASKQGKMLGNILIAGFGVGLSWSGVILQCIK